MRYHVTFRDGVGVTCEARDGQLFPVAPGPWFHPDRPVVATGARVAQVVPEPSRLRLAVRLPVYLQDSGRLLPGILELTPSDPDAPVDFTPVARDFRRFTWDRPAGDHHEVDSRPRRSVPGGVLRPPGGPPRGARSDGRRRPVR